MTIDVEKISHLARLTINPDHIPNYTQDLSNILELVEQMNQVDTKDVAPLFNPLDATQPLRPDEVTETNQREKFQAIAPQVDAGLYLVPQVIE